MKFTGQFAAPRIDLDGYRTALDKAMRESHCPGRHGMAQQGPGGDSRMERRVPRHLRETCQHDRHEHVTHVAESLPCLIDMGHEPAKAS